MDQFSSAIVVGTGNLSSALALRVGATMVNIIIGWHDAEMVKNTVNTIMPETACPRNGRHSQSTGSKRRQLHRQRRSRACANGFGSLLGQLGGKTVHKVILDR